MRIERREDGEYLVGASHCRTGCGMFGKPPSMYVCTYHLDGEHLATFMDDGPKFICERWPLEQASEPQPERLFSTPAEARAASAAHVREIAAGMNRKLAAGQRWFSVPQPLFSEVRHGLEGAGWRVMLGGTGAGGQSFTVAEASEEER